MKIMFFLVYFSICFIKTCKNFPTTPVFYRLSDEEAKVFNITKFNMTTHLEYEHVKRICANRDVICKSNDTNVCAVRKLIKTYQFKDFENSCYLFLNNMCDDPGNEFYIAASHKCTGAVSRRHYVESGVLDTTPATPAGNYTGEDGNTTAPNLREGTMSTVYDLLRSADGHPCAYTCPDVYQPACININRNYGKYLKFLHFVNHCQADQFYCAHWKEFEVPPGRDFPSVFISFLDWSYCGAQRYLNFMFTTQAASSMGHYGWLEGDQRYSKILEPWQRKPGFG